MRLDELTGGAVETKHAAIKELYLKHVVPFDRLTTKSGTVRIKPIPVARGERLPAQFGIQELTREGQFAEPQAVNAAEVRKIEYFEEIALSEANAVLVAKSSINALEQIDAAERLMTATLRFHDYARENPRERPIRKGRGWDEMRKPLAARLREVRLEMLKQAVAVSDWQRVRETGTRLMLAYPKDNGVAVAVASVRVLEAKRLLASEKHFDHVKARELLDEFEANYPGGGGDAVRAIRTEITQLAQQAFTRAKDKHAVKDLIAARDALTRAAALDPTLPGVRDLQRELKLGYQTLYVGVRHYPEQMSPITARLDSEKQVVELLFEGLLAEVPDDGGGARYRPAGAVAMPAVVPNAREFALRTFERDATGRFGFESHDVVGTLKLLATRPETWSAYSLPWFDELPTPRDNNTVRMAFKQGHPDPRSLLTFKLLPARWMIDTGKAIDDAGFAETPAGTGPYKLQSNAKANGNTRAKWSSSIARFMAAGERANQPFIKEIRLIEVTKVHNVIEAFQQGSLHILTDVPTADVAKYRAALTGKANDYIASNNRRIHMLAVNHRRPALQNKLLRQGLALAIDREAILNEVYRAGQGDLHKAMSGPFPPLSWANVKGPSGQAIPLVNRDLAFTRLRLPL